MSSHKTGIDWTNLGKFPCNHALTFHDLKGVIKLDDYEFIMVRDIEIYEKTAIRKYNIYTKMWTEIWKSDGRIKSENHSVMINDNKDKIYLYPSGGYLIQIDLKHKNQYSINYDFRRHIDDPMSTRLLKCNNQYHLLYNARHCTERKITFEVIDEDDDDKNDDHELKINIISKTQLENVHTESGVYYSNDRMEVCILGEKKGTMCTNRVHFHSVPNGYNGDPIQNERCLAFPTKYSTFVITSDEKYMITFGGYYHSYESSLKHGNGWNRDNKQGIYVLNLDTMKIEVSKVQCPSEIKNYREMRALLMNKDDRLVTGFINDTITNCPLDVIILIQNWCCKYNVHLLAIYDDIKTSSGKQHAHHHFCIDLGEILGGLVI